MVNDRYLGDESETKGQVCIIMRHKNCGMVDGQSMHTTKEINNPAYIN